MQTQLTLQQNYLMQFPSPVSIKWIASLIDATIIGNVTLEEDVNIWFGTVLRGDVNTIHIGRQTNIQDLCCIHGDPGIPCTVGDRVTVGHGAVDAEMIRHGWEHYVETSQQYKATES